MKKSSHHYRLGASVVVLNLLASNAAFADVVGRIAIESGGDQVEEIFTDDGSEEIRGGGLVHLELGLSGNLVSGNPAWDTEGSAGYKFDSASFQNGDVEFTRFTLNLMQYYRATEVVRIGAGVTYHLNGNFDADIPDVLIRDIDYDDTLGFMVAVDYIVSDLLYLGARVTLIDYEQSDVEDSEPIDGNSFGLYVSINL